MAGRWSARGSVDTQRTEAFSDGVFAIAITLLVLTIDPPSPAALGHHSLARQLLAAWPSYLAYVAAFLAIGVTWMNHHSVFAKISAVDPVLQWWNLVLLLVVSFAPFPTRLAADYMSESLTGASARTAIFVFVVVSGLRPLVWVLIWRHLNCHRDLLERSVTETDGRLEVRRAAIGVLLYALAAGVALFVPAIALALCLALAVFYAVTARGRHSPEQPTD